jgi:MFS family permease
MGRFGRTVAGVTALLGGSLTLMVTWRSELWVCIVLTAAAVVAAFLYGFLWERLLGDPSHEEDLRGVDPISTAGRRKVADSVYLTAPLAVFAWIVVFVTFLLLGRFLQAATMVGVTAVAVLTVRWMLTEPPHRRRRRRRTQPRK